MQADIFGIVGSVQEGAFRVEQVVAEGGFAVVYRAHHEGLRADVALKCLKLPGTLNELEQAEFLQKFRREGELLFRLSAAIPTVVRPLHVGTLKSPKASFVPFIALEWLEGRNLEAFIDERRRRGKAPLGLQRAVQLLEPAARALELAHEFPGPTGPVSILHCDLKPENLFVVDVHGREMIKILDFGIGTVKGAATQIVGRTSLEQSSFGAFTPAYGAPEQWLPKRFGQAGTWTDVWGLALTLVQLVTAKAPLEGDAHAVMGAAIDEQLRPTPRSLGMNTSDAAESIFRKALAVDPKQRYHDVGEFWDLLEAEVGVPNTKQAFQLAASIPDLEDDREPGSGLPSQRPAPGRPPLLASLDDDVEPGSDADVIPNIGGFRLDAGSSTDAIELGSIAGNGAALGESRPRALVAHTVSLVQPGRKSFLHELEGPLKLLALAALIMALDWGHTLLIGEAFQIGPARAFWLAAPLAVLAVVKALFRLLDH